MNEMTSPKMVESALEFMLMAYDGDSGYRHHCGVGDDVSFPAYRGPVRSVANARQVLNAMKAEEHAISNEMIFAVMARAEDFGVNLEDWQANALIFAASQAKREKDE